uniref:Uncharacterized protein n=1 Tax=viral metagenome TaxID=1070528 RepID=A0A6C0J6I7_9ZZZZ
MYTEENKQLYLELQKSRLGQEYIYSEKEYPANFTKDDKRIVNSRYSPNNSKISGKIIMLFVSIIILTLIFARISKDNRSYTTGFFIVIVAFLMMIPLVYIMKVAYYEYLIYFILLVIFSSLGYGWGIFSIIMNLTLKKKPIMNSNKNI